MNSMLFCQSALKKYLSFGGPSQGSVQRTCSDLPSEAQSLRFRGIPLERVTLSIPRSFCTRADH